MSARNLFYHERNQEFSHYVAKCACIARNQVFATNTQT